MAMTTCKECRKPVATEAPACPHCGVLDPSDGHEERAAAARNDKADADRSGARAVGILVVVILVLVVGAQLLGGGDSEEAATPTAPVSRLSEVVYEVVGTATSVDLTLSDGDGGTSQQSGVAVPLVNKSGQTGLRLRVPSGSFLYISAQNQDDRGTVTCRIKVDGKVIDETTSSGAYVIASCDGRT